MGFKHALAILAVLTTVSGCDDSINDSSDSELRTSEVDEIVENLLVAGFPDTEIMIVGEQVILGQDAVVGLEASRELAGVRWNPSRVISGEEFRQYRTTNLVTNAGVICVDGSDFTGTLSTALNSAISNYNNQNLSFSMTRTTGSNAGCDAEITANVIAGNGGVAGFPAGGNPYSEINIGSTVASYGVNVATHVITHELGHCIGFRHTDYFNRSISCGSGGNEGTAGVGAHHIPGTPTGATSGGSVMNSCFSGSSTGVWTSGDVTALQELYGNGGGDGDGDGDGEPSPTSCVGACGGNAGQCWCDDACANYGDCCSDKVAVCG